MTDPTLRSTPELADADERALAGLLTRAHRPPRIRPAARSAILGELKARHRTQKVTALSSKRRYRAWAAVVAAAALLTVWLTGATQPILHDNPGHAPRMVTFGDGTTMVLDAGARVVERRSTELELVSGRALFDIAADRSYVVASSHGRVTGSGARFVVADGGGVTTAAVARGRLQAASEAGETVLAAGDQAVLRAGTLPVREPAQRLSYLASWARETLAAEQPPETKPIRRGNLKARVPDSSTEWPLPMRKLAVNVFVEDGVVRTTFDHTFFNHLNRDLEGVYSFSLPADAAVSRLAMYVNGKLMEGGIVERQRGRNIYEDIVYRRRDPALLEWMSGNELKVRIFPLPARTEKRILMSYTQVLERLYDEQRLVVPIPELDAPVGEVEFHVRVADGARYLLSSSSHPLSVATDGTDRVATFKASEHSIGDDLVVTLREEEPKTEAVRAYADDEHKFLLARLQPQLSGARGSRAPQDWVVLFDTSASRSAGAIRAQERMALSIVSQLDVYDRVAVVAFDATQRAMPGGFHRVGDFDAGVLGAFLAVEARDRIGYTDLAGAFVRARELFAARGDERERRGNVLYIGDGVPTAGKLKVGDLRTAISGHTFVGVGVGDRADSAILRDLAEHTGGSFVKVASTDDLTWSAFDLVSELNTPRLLDLRARVVNAAGGDIAGEVHVTQQAAEGEDISVIARLPRGSEPAEVVLTGTIGGRPWSSRVAAREAMPGAAYLPRLWAQRHIDVLAREDGDAHAKVITDLGLANFLVTPFTSLLVLETEADYVKHKVTRPSEDRWARYAAPADIEVVREPTSVAAIPFGSVVLRQRMATGTGPGFGAWDGRDGDGWFADDFNTVVDLPRTWTTTQGIGDELEGIPLAANRRRRLRAFGPRLQNATARTRQTGEWYRRPERDPVSGATGKLPPADLMAGEIDKRAYAVGDQGRWVQPIDGLLDVSGSLEVLTEQTGYWELGGYRTSLRDLTTLIPQLFADSIDAEREASRRAKTETKSGTISDAARTLLDSAVREHATYRFPSGTEMRTTATGFSVSRTTPMGLSEQLTYDGARIVAVYPDVLLITERGASGAVMATLSRHALFLTPSVASLADYYDVTSVGARMVRIAPVGGGAPTTLTLDEDGRVVRWQRAAITVNVQWKADSIVLIPEIGERVELKRTTDGGAPHPVERKGSAWTTVTLPLREQASVQKALDAAKPGTASWRALTRQALAVQAASASPDWRLIDAIVAAGERPTRGELLLASSGVRPASAKTLEALAGDPVADLLQAELRLRAGAGPDAFKRAASTADAFARLFAIRRLTTTYSSYEDLKERYEELGRLGVSAQVRLGSIVQVAQYARPEQADEIVRELDELASEPGLRSLARWRAANHLQRAGRLADSAERFEQIIADSDARGDFVDASPLRNARLAKSGGKEVFDRWMLARRDRLIAIGGTDALLAAARMLDAWGTPADLDVVMNVVRTSDIDDAGDAYQLATILQRRGFTADADRLVRRHTDSGPHAHAMLLLASRIAEGDSRFSEAAALVRKAMERRDAMPLTELRNLYRRRFDLHVAHTRSMSLPHIDEALSVASAWRREDPDNDQIDTLCYDALTSRGDHLGAFRHLSSIIERHPGEGSSYAAVAGSLARRGRHVEAELTLARAVEVEPTNPTWLLRYADMLTLLGKSGAAEAALVRVADGEWQDRFANQVANAKRRLGR